MDRNRVNDGAEIESSQAKVLAYWSYGMVLAKACV